MDVSQGRQPSNSAMRNKPAKTGEAISREGSFEPIASRK